MDGAAEGGIKCRFALAFFASVLVPSFTHSCSHCSLVIFTSHCASCTISSSAISFQLHIPPPPQPPRPAATVRGQVRSRGPPGRYGRWGSRQGSCCRTAGRLALQGGRVRAGEHQGHLFLLPPLEDAAQEGREQHNLVEVHRLISTSGEEEHAKAAAAPLLLPVVPEQRPGEAGLQGAHTNQNREDTLEILSYKSSSLYTCYVSLPRE